MREEQRKFSSGFEPTPERVHAQLARTLETLPDKPVEPARPARLPGKRWAVVLLALLAVAVTAYAISRYTVSYFYTERWAAPAELDELLAGEVRVSAQESTLAHLRAEVTSAVWVEANRLAFTVSFFAGGDGEQPLPTEAMGVDGIRHDHVWWSETLEGRPEILPLAEWEKRHGKPRLFLPGELDTTQEGIALRQRSMDWLQEKEEAAYLFLVEVSGELSPGGELTITLPVLEAGTPGFGMPMEERAVTFTVPYLPEEN